MAQQIKQANIWGRIGSGIGKGLAEQLPEEIQRGRLASGLQEITSEQGRKMPLTAQLGALYSLPGVTPQMIQTFGELARLNQQGQAFQNASGQDGQRISPEANQRVNDAARNGMPVESRPLGESISGEAGQMPQPPTPMQRDSGVSPPQIEEPGALSERERTRLPWTPQERNSTISDYISQGFLPDQARQLAADDEARYLAEPGAYQQRRDELRQKAAEAESEFDKQLRTKLQLSPGDKGAVELAGQIPGTALNGLKREMERWLRLNPNKTIKDAADEFSNRGLDLAKTITKFNKDAEISGPEDIIRGAAILDRLRSYQKIFDETGNRDEFKSMLVEKFGLSQPRAASIAFPLTKDIKSYVNSFSPFVKGKPLENSQSNSRRAAIELEDKIGPNDSVLAIANALSEKYPYFDGDAFFEQLDEDSDRLNRRQILELTERTGKILPTWGDFKLFPWLGNGGKK